MDANAGMLWSTAHSGALFGTQAALVRAEAGIMKKLLGVLLFTMQMWMLPALAIAAPDHDDHRDEHQRYYDRDHRDYHEWNEAEERAYRHWLMEERHERQYRDYNRLNAERQREYWRWRHEHPDWR
jgi:hypothetical protein